ncbi:hypothetical protein [Chitinophaga rhizophila]|uniref:Outer membrane efflux protein n=1 Tax=Chitinophaga rhizophila TaxID=2866212 RepID=A0ABS7GE36_9BACT|nr:hypothetical protein [Chitinophaga rhizophila]MBW8685686.1 hypothetical protein [Chitinophaga rhizophila]
MKRAILLFLIGISVTATSFAQQDSTVVDKIKLERDHQLKELNDKLKQNEDEIRNLKSELIGINTNETKKKMMAMENLQVALDSRLAILEKTPKIRVGLNGQLAFTELLSIQRDVQPADLFLISQQFFSQLGNISNIQQYKEFSDWKAEYDKWYSKKGSGDQMFEFLNSSLSLVSNVANKVPLYGSVVQTVSSGVNTLIMSVGSQNRDLKSRTPSMLRILNIASQFEQQKSVIDHEWDAITNELNQLQHENQELLSQQLAYYGLDTAKYRKDYFLATLDSRREAYKNECRLAISRKILAMEADTLTKGKWPGQIETFMYKVQSLRMRFGQLTARMMINISRYNELITDYSDSTIFPPTFTMKVLELSKTLELVKDKFGKSFNPARYIEDSAVMYIEGNVSGETGI